MLQRLEATNMLESLLGNNMRHSLNLILLNLSYFMFPSSPNYPKLPPIHITSQDLLNTFLFYLLLHNNIRSSPVDINSNSRALPHMVLPYRLLLNRTTPAPIHMNSQDLHNSILHLHCYLLAATTLITNKILIHPIQPIHQCRSPMRTRQITARNQFISPPSLPHKVDHIQPWAPCIANPLTMDILLLPIHYCVAQSTTPFFLP